jgi:ATP adenylyltransferase
MVIRAGEAVAMNERCPFCHPEPAWVFHEGERVLALWDAFPASPGHALVVPRRHVAGWFDATREEQRELLEAVDVARARIEASHAPDGYNIGVNVGAAAGQTVFHLHVHVIPRYDGDVPDPTGGVRLALPHRGNYLREGSRPEPDHP